MRHRTRTAILDPFWLVVGIMTYFEDIHTYLHQSSLLIQAYPQQTRITTKYSLPRKPKPGKSNATATETETDTSTKVKRDPSATLTLKTYHPDSGICLKYRTDKAAEVGRLMSGLGRLAKGEVIELPTAQSENQAGAGIAIGGGESLSAGGPAQDDKMDIDTVPAVEAKTASQMTTDQPQNTGGKKKKKNKK